MAKFRKSTEHPSLTDQLRQAIVESGLSHYAIAKATGVSQPVLTRFVNGTRSVSIETASKLANHFGMWLAKPRQSRR